MSLFGKLAGFARSPHGRKLLSEAQKVMSDPKNRERARELSGRLRKKPPAEPPAPPGRAVRP